jgi:AcrR family transcriptional regulator
MRFIVDAQKRTTRLPQILRAALHLFVRQGIEGTTTKDIAGRAQVAEGALYRHFKSKEELAWYLFASNMNAFTHDLLAAAMPKAGAQARLAAVIRYCCESYEKDRDLFHYLVLVEHKELQKFARTYTDPGQGVMRIIEEGQQAGEVRAGDVSLLAAVVIGALQRACVIRQAGSNRQSLADLTQDLTDLTWRAVAV